MIKAFRDIKYWICTLLLTLSATSIAEDDVFRARLYNKEYDVFLKINLYEETETIPGQDILGETYGYLKKSTDQRVWIITGVEIDKSGKRVKLEMINDYGSEDLTATLTCESDSIYTLRQDEGSTLKVAGKGKWIKLPKIMKFKK